MSKKYSSKVDSKVTKSIESTPHFTVQDLVECYDDIPLLTKKINEADNPVSRFQGKTIFIKNVKSFIIVI